MIELLVSFIVFTCAIVYVVKLFLDEIRRLNHVIISRSPREYAAIEKKLDPSKPDDPETRARRPVLEGS